MLSAHFKCIAMGHWHFLYALLSSRDRGKTINQCWTFPPSLLSAPMKQSFFCFWRSDKFCYVRISRRFVQDYYYFHLVSSMPGSKPHYIINTVRLVSLASSIKNYQSPKTVIRSIKSQSTILWLGLFSHFGCYKEDCGHCLDQRSETFAIKRSIHFSVS